METKSIFIEGRLWIDKEVANTYYSTRIWVNGEVVEIVEKSYGYDQQFLWDAIERLIKSGHLAENLSSPYEIRKAGIDLYQSATYGLKRELFKK